MLPNPARGGAQASSVFPYGNIQIHRTDRPPERLYDYVVNQSCGAPPRGVARTASSPCSDTIMDTVRFSKHSIVAVPKGGTLFSVAFRGHQLLTDQPERAGGTDCGPTPLELLGAALAGCVALYVHKYCEKHDLVAEDLAIEVKPVWRENPGRIGRYETIVHIPESIPHEHHAGIEQAAQSCPVHHTLTHAPEMTMQLRTDPLVPA
jgi:putative redox protein